MTEVEMENDATNSKRSAESQPKQKFKKQKVNNKIDASDNNNKVQKNELFKPPTVEELNQLRETEILFNSNLFRLQTEELLKEIRLKQKRKKEIRNWIEKFKTFTDNLTEYDDVKLSDYNLYLDENPKKLKGAFKQIAQNIPCKLQADQNTNIKLIKPHSVDIIGLFNVHAIIGQKINIILNLVMPKSCFVAKDYLNARYIIKRSLYLSYIATQLKSAELCSSMSYTYLNGNELIPILQVKPKGVKNTIMKIILTPEEDTFKLPRFELSKNNIRSAYFNRIFNESLSEDEGNTIITPFYNSVILNDLTLKVNDEFRHESIKNMQGVCDGLILLTVWLYQRQLSDGYGGFSDELIYALVAHLTTTNKINKHMSSYQVTRNVWNHLAQSNWDTEGFSMSEHKVDIASFHEHYDVVIVDRTGYYNLAANLDLNVYLRVKYEATLALLYLDDGKLNSFQSLFMTKMEFYKQYDAVINIFNNTAFTKIYKEIDDNTKLDYITFKYPLILKQIMNTLKHGLTDRIVCVVPKLRSDLTWEIGTQNNTNDISINIGVQLNFANLFKVVDKGPPAYDPLAAKFREFWGDKSELRRFKDGSITEAVYWPAKNLQDKRIISKEIIEFVLENKFKIKNYNIVYDQFDHILRIYNTPAVEEGNLKVVNIFDELSKILRDLKIPLSISSIQGVSESFCHTDPFPPEPSNYKSGHKITFETETNILFKNNVELKMSPKFIPPVRGIIQMVHHSKWPNNLQAMCNLRTAFYLQIAALLKSSANVRCNVTHDYLDILYHGLVFRFVIFHPKQIALMKRHQDEKGVVSFRDTPESLQAEKEFAIIPKIMGALNGVNSLYPSYGPGTILMKRWINSQLLDEFHVPSVVVALLSASLYLDSSPYSIPILPNVAFVRLLALLSQYNFTTSTLIVNFNQELKKEQIDEIETSFQQHRDDYAPLCIITPFDTKSSLTENTPSKQILYRLSILAKECLDVIEKNIYSEQLFNVLGFFKPNLKGYNIIIHLQQFLNPRKQEFICNEIDSKYTANYNEENNDKMPIVNFNPVDLYLTELRTHYGKFALFFHDTYGGNVIAVLWKPEVFQKFDFKIAQVEGKKLMKDSEKLEVNTDALIEDFYNLGEGIVNNIEIL